MTAALSRARRSVLLGLLLLLPAFASAVEVAVSGVVPWIDCDGYTPVIVTINAELPVTITLEARQGPATATRTLSVPAAPVRTTLLVPTRPEASSWVELAWSGPGLRSGSDRISQSDGRLCDLVVVDPDEQVPLKPLLTAVKAVITEVPGNPREPSWRSKSPYSDDRLRRLGAESLPDRWQGYPLWLAVAVTPAGERRLSLEQRQAIAAWSRAGGALFITSPAQAAGWRGLGAAVQDLSATALITRINAVAATANYEPQRTVVPGTGDLPVIGFTLIAILFALVAGPGVLIWATRRHQRSLILVVVPVLSFATCVLLLVYGLFADGLSARRAVVQGLVLDQSAGCALLATCTGYFTGLSPGPFVLDPDDRMTPHDQRLFSEKSWQDRMDAPSVALDWTAGQQASGPWIAARRHNQLLTVRPVAERRRLVFVRSAAGWRVTNGFDQPLAALDWHDPAGLRWHHDGPLPSGSQADLVPGASTTVNRDRRLGMEWQLASARWESQPGTYTARFAGFLAPIPGPLAEDRLDPATLVLGRVAGEPASPNEARGALR